VVATLLISLAVATQLSFAQTPGTVVHGGRLTGRVVDNVGVIPGVTVTIKRPGSAVLHTTITDVSGVYRFEGLAAGSYLIQASIQGFYYSRREVLVAEGPTTSEPDVRLMGRAMCECVHYTEEEKRELARTFGQLQGRVTDRNGRPLPFASVTLTGPSSGRTEANWNGEFAFAASVGNYTIRVEYPGVAAVARTGLAIAASKVTRIQLTMPVQRTDRDSGEFGDLLGGCACGHGSSSD
jgi:hypothetical protein